jgi:hypothetical protein
MEAINALNLENPHSDYLAWLLQATGPLSDFWLLRSLYAKCLPDEIWPGTPTSIDREVPNDFGRPDIVIAWGTFNVVIENKVWSSEGDNQVVRYLEGFGIAEPSDGRVIYLTPHGDWPASISREDPRVVALSYFELGDLIEKGLREKIEPSERGRVFAAEFRDGILKLLNVRSVVEKPTISESSMLFLANAKHIAVLEKQACQESADFIDWLCTEAEHRIERLLRTDLVKLRTGKGIYFRRPQWAAGGAVFGIAFTAAANPRTHLLTKQGQPPWVGVATFLPDQDGEGQKMIVGPITERLVPLLKKSWPHAADLANPYPSFPLWRYVPIPGNSDFEQWSNMVLTALEELSEKLDPVLSAAASLLQS